eukprot:15251646-Heterocapsa_arctica.AAC.1
MVHGFDWLPERPGAPRGCCPTPPPVPACGLPPPFLPAPKWLSGSLVPLLAPPWSASVRLRLPVIPLWGRLSLRGLFPSGTALRCLPSKAAQCAVLSDYCWWQ